MGDRNRAHAASIDLIWVLQAAFKAPSVSSLGTGSPKAPLSQSLDWDKVKAEDKTLVHQVHTLTPLSGPHSYVAAVSAELDLLLRHDQYITICLPLNTKSLILKYAICLSWQTSFAKVAARLSASF